MRIARYLAPIPKEGARPAAKFHAETRRRGEERYLVFPAKAGTGSRRAGKIAPTPVRFFEQLQALGSRIRGNDNVDLNSVPRRLRVHVFWSAIWAWPGRGGADNGSDCGAVSAARAASVTSVASTSTPGCKRARPSSTTLSRACSPLLMTRRPITRGPVSTSRAATLPAPSTT